MALAVKDTVMRESDNLVAEAEAMANAAMHCSNPRRYKILLRWAREIVTPLSKAGHSSAMWLLCTIPSDEKISPEEFDARHLEQVRSAARAGSIKAKFRLACMLDEEPSIFESASLFADVAATGHAHGMWCHGLNLISGTGGAKDFALGISFILNSANLGFEGAIQFLAAANTNGSHGFARDLERAALWSKKLSEPSVIRY